MSELIEKLKEPFQRQLDEQSRLLGSGWAEFEDHKEIVSQWAERKNKIVITVIKPMEKWIADLKKMSRPFINKKKYKRTKRRMKRTRHATFYHWPGFMKGFRLALLETINIIRILFIFSFYIGLIALLGFGVMKLIDLII